MDGVVQARAVALEGGKIILSGGDEGIVAVSGKLDASGLETGQKGGTVKVLGEKVGLFAGAGIDASGDAGGGDVLIGGNYQGKGPEPNAKQTFVAKGASVKADATGNGDGGEIIVWSDEVTRFRGDLSARGGQEGGDGGFIEVSGKQGLEFVGTASVEATKGLDGNILFDPQTIDIIEDGGGEDDQASDGEIRFPDVGVNGNVFFTITNDAIQNLNGNLLFQAQDSIFINAPLNFVNLGQGESISFQANGGIGVNFDVTTQGADLRFEADLDRVTSEGTTLDIGDPGDAETDPSSVQIGTNGGNIDLIAQNIGIVDGSVIDAGTGDIHLARIVDANPGLGSAPAAADITVGSEAFLSENDFDAFVTSGTLTLGRASFFGPDGILDAAPLTAPALTVDAPIQANATNLALISAGALNINADVTAASLTASGATIGLQDVTTTGDQSYTGALTFNSDYITNGGNFLVVGNTLLESDSSVSTGGGGITFNGSIDSAVVEGDPAGLELDAGGEGISRRYLLRGRRRSRAGNDRQRRRYHDTRAFRCRRYQFYIQR
ncbi:MAG: hypothetical protein ACREU9_02550 [Gammaproteobacteria bacterium]